MVKLNQILAIEKGVKTRVHEFLSATYHAFQKPQLFTGFTRTYAKRQEDGEDLPQEQQRVQADALSLLNDVGTRLAELIDVTATKDKANCTALADIELDGRVLAKGIPATQLLFLEKTLGDLKSEINRLPELDPAQTWTRDEQNQVYRSQPVQSVRSKKTPRVVVKYEATQHHPAQTELLYEDVPVGTWTAVQFSGAVSRQDKRALLERVTKLIDAVKIAREKANESTCERVAIGATLLDFVIKG